LRWGRREKAMSIRRKGGTVRDADKRRQRPHVNKKRVVAQCREKKKSHAKREQRPRKKKPYVRPSPQKKKNNSNKKNARGTQED